jgi:hypothetical protein
MSQALSSRDRIHAALDYRPPDRVPIDIGGTFVTGIHVTGRGSGPRQSDGGWCSGYAPIYGAGQRRWLQRERKRP